LVKTIRCIYVCIALIFLFYEQHRVVPILDQVLRVDICQLLEYLLMLLYLTYDLFVLDNGIPKNAHLIIRCKVNHGLVLYWFHRIKYVNSS
jgi:hypothetical protein